ncbi:hypothetical protein DOT_2710 [Desulfosporosinus sp. OT]|nr:hypothetical protein DOT_2710 [Desulfosporosinus sp. OT]
MINSLRQKLIADDNLKALSFYSEEAIQGDENRTMLYLGPSSKKIFMGMEIT